ncbi:hypothetical protein PTKIN_Ptkin16aG0100000 [Pterospermum kingtungense]
MSSRDKGKGKAKEVVTGKRKSSAGRCLGGDDETRRKKKAVLQFFEDSADVDDDDSGDDSEMDDFFLEEEPDLNVNNEPGKAHDLPFVPKEEVDEEEFDKLMEERYRNAAAFVTHAEDSYEAKGSIDTNSNVPSSKDPNIWKVKCVVGRERHSAFCLMQKFVDMKSLGNKLQIISAFSVDHVKGFFYIEADRECDIIEACRGLSYIYFSRVAPVPSNEVYHLLTVRNKRSEVSVGMWARVKNGKYKGDLAQVVAVKNERKRATVKLIPRIDLQAMAAKFGGGVSINRAVTPAPKLISSTELEEFRPLIQYRRDRETSLGFQILDGMMLKDGYLYKRVSLDSLNCWGVMPTEEELLKFSHSENNESDDLEWLSQLYGEKKKKKTITNDKGGEKGEGSSEPGMDDSFELYNLVCFGRKDFGLIVGMEKDDHYKILKEASEGPAVVTVEKRQLKSGPLDTKFTALDQHSKTISINDTVKVLEGQHEGKQGLVRQIYRGTIFLYDENETDNGGYFCCKSQMCEKIKQLFDAFSEKGDEPPSDFGDFMSSPKSPLSPKKPWEEKETRSDFNKGNREGMFSVGQTLRIRVGPLKGYLCRVLAVRFSEVTVKLDSKHKVLTVKNEHLAEVQGKSFAANTSENDGSSSFKPFDLGADGSSGGWLDKAEPSAEGGGWNAEGSSWPSFSGSGTSQQAEPNHHSNLFDSGETDQKKDGEDTAWDCKVTSNQNSSWGAASCSGDNDKKTDAASTAWENEGTKQNSAWATGSGDQVASRDGWNKAAPRTDSGSGASDAWGKAISSSGDPSGASKGVGGGLGQAGNLADSSGITSWEKEKNINAGNDSWNKSESWDKGKNVTPSSAGGNKENWGSSTLAAEDAKGGWGSAGGSQNQSDGWNKGKMADIGTSWGKQDGGSSWGKQHGGSSWGEQPPRNVENDSKSWNNQNDGWSKPSSDRDQGSGGWDKGKMESIDGTNLPDSGWGNRGNWNSKPGGSANQESGWAKKNDSGFGSGGATKESSWGKKSDWNSGPVDANQDTNWGKKSSWVAGTSDGGQDSGCSKRDSWNSGSGSANQDPGWAKKNDSDFGSGGGTKDSSWEKKSDWNKGSADVNQDSKWGKKSSWGTGLVDSGQDSGWNKKGSWNPGSSVEGQDSGWGKKSNWNSGSDDSNLDSGWKSKGNWKSGSENEDQKEPFSDGGGGRSWRGGFGGRDGSVAREDGNYIKSTCIVFVVGFQHCRYFCYRMNS